MGMRPREPGAGAGLRRGARAAGSGSGSNPKSDGVDAGDMGAAILARNSQRSAAVAPASPHASPWQTRALAEARPAPLQRGTSRPWKSVSTTTEASSTRLTNTQRMGVRLGLWVVRVMATPGRECPGAFAGFSRPDTLSIGWTRKYPDIHLEILRRTASPLAPAARSAASLRSLDLGSGREPADGQQIPRRDAAGIRQRGGKEPHNAGREQVESR